MEIGYDEPLKQVITYDNLYYAENSTDIGKQYTFQSSIDLAPTELGLENSFMLEVEDGYSTIQEETEFIIEPGSSTPIINNFDVIKPESLDYVDPNGEMEISYSGDSKSIPEDIGVGLRPTFLNKAQVVGYELDDTGNVISEEIALSEIKDIDTIDETTGEFSGTLTTKADVFSGKTNYRIALKLFYGNDTYPTDVENDPSTRFEVFDHEGEYLDIRTKGEGDLEVKLMNNVVTYDSTSNIATLTFDYSQALPSGVTDSIDM